MNASGSLSRRRFLVASLGLGLGTAAIAAGGSPGQDQGALVQSSSVHYVNADYVRLRSGPGTSYPILTTLSAGAGVTAFEQKRARDGSQWTRVHISVQADDLEGYVPSQFLSRATQGEESPKFPIGSTFFIEAGRGRASLRNAPGVGTGVLRTVPTGTRGEILGAPISSSGLHWFPVEIDGQFGYLVDDVLIPASAGIEDPGFVSWPVGTEVVVSDGPLNLRDKPRGKVIATYRTGSRATTTGKAALMANGEDIAWYPVRTADGRRGFFAANFLKRS